ncbi:MAG: hypothetical protein DRQ37_00510 [Gammaproteobacteria bacterium]|nr:MAG: hypothetical protein DRQ37_00510 [Gammaproteobacteria bacterium]
MVGRRHIHLEVGEDGMLVVRAPYRARLLDAEVAIHAHRKWVLKTLAAAQARAERFTLEPGRILPYLNQRLRLVFTAAGKTGVRRAGCNLEVASPDADRPTRSLLQAWYQDEARRELPQRLRRIAVLLSVSPAGISVRNQRTRWGSCSAGGRISLNWRLLMLPARLADYVIVHELCHLRHLNHSAAFWNTVAAAIPDHRQRRGELRALEGALPL